MATYVTQGRYTSDAVKGSWRTPVEGFGELQ
jgi:hypothetical protein